VRDKQRTDVDIRPWSEGDFSLLERLMGDPAMTYHLGGPEIPAKIRERHERYCMIGASGTGRVFVILVGPDGLPAGWIGYWETEWREQHIWETGWGVLPELQSQGIATRATAAMLELVRAEKKHRYLHAFPSVDNGPSNAVCRKAGFTLLGEVDIDYPPGNFKLSNDWRLDLFDDSLETTPRNKEAGGEETRTLAHTSGFHDQLCQGVRKKTIPKQFTCGDVTTRSGRKEIWSKPWILWLNLRC